MTVDEQRAAVEAHPPMLVDDGRDGHERVYDLREIALWILDHPERAEYRLDDWWNGPQRTHRFHPDTVMPVYFLPWTVELAAYRLIAHACRDERYAPDDVQLVVRGGAPLFESHL